MSGRSGQDDMEDEDGENDSIISSENFAAEDKELEYEDMAHHGLDPMDDDEEMEGEHEEDEEGLETQDSVQNMVPIEFAKAHIAKIEDDMKTMHERHVKLMREMDSNYKMIEKETQEYYVEFL